MLRNNGTSDTFYHKVSSQSDLRSDISVIDFPFIQFSPFSYFLHTRLLAEVRPTTKKHKARGSASL